MLRGFLSSGNLCLIHHLKLFWPHTPSTASNRKGAKIQHKFWWFCQKIFFSKQQNKVLKLLNSRIWKPLKSSVVIFQALETSSSSWTSAAFAASAASTASKGQFSQEKVWSWLSDHHWHQNNQYWSFFVEWIAKNPIFHWYMALFLTEVVEAVWGQIFFKWWIKHKFPLFRKPQFLVDLSKHLVKPGLYFVSIPNGWPCKK